MKIKSLAVVISTSWLLFLSACGDKNTSQTTQAGMATQSVKRPQDIFLEEYLSMERDQKNIDTNVRGGDEKWAASQKQIADYKKKIYGTKIENWTCTVENKTDLANSYGDDITMECIGNINDRPSPKVTIDNAVTRQQAEAIIANQIKNDQDFTLYLTKASASNLKKVFEGDELAFSGEITFIDHFMGNNVKMDLKNVEARFIKQAPGQ